jgi:hypothetical protein
MATVDVALTPDEARDVLAGQRGIDPDRFAEYPDAILGPAILTEIDTQVQEFTAGLVKRIGYGDFAESILRRALLEDRWQRIEAAARGVAVPA